MSCAGIDTQDLPDLLRLIGFETVRGKDGGASKGLTRQETRGATGATPDPFSVFPAPNNQR
jgi:hypothetical protein